MQPKKHEQVLSQSSEKMNDKQKEMDPSAQARQIVDEDKKNIPGLEITVDIIRIDDTPVDIRSPEGRNIKYYLWALAFFSLYFCTFNQLFVFITRRRLVLLASPCRGVPNSTIKTSCCST